MKRVASRMKLFPGMKEEYRKRHDEIWPELKAALRNCGISDYSIFLDEKTGDLFAVFDLADENSIDLLPHLPIMKKWWAHMKDIMETNDDDSPISKPLEEVFFMK